MRTNLTGRLLIASPYLGDGNFLRSVVFVIRHDVYGAFGLAINRPTERRFRELVELSSTDGRPREDDWIYRGGPVDGPLLALHDLAGVGEPCGSMEVDNADQAGPADGDGAKFIVHDHPAEPFGSMSIELGNPPAWITGDDDHLRILLRRPDARVKYVADYSGWGPGQLDEELRVGGWLVGDADADLIFGDPDEIWELAVKRCGHEILTEISPGMHFGDPNLN
jgi:putative transcriptional regulator